MGHLSPSTPQGPNPAVSVYRLSDLTCLATLNPPVTLAFSALAFSADGLRLAVCTDEPDLTLTIYAWQQSNDRNQLLVQASLAKPVQHVSFQPYNADALVTTGSGQTISWTIDKLRKGHDITSAAVELPEGFEPTCHTWCPHGLYVGGAGGELLSLDPATYKPMPAEAEAVPAAQQQQLSESFDLPPSEEHHMEAEDQAKVSERPQFLSGLLMIAATDVGSPVTAICVSRDHVAVAGGTSTVRWFSHARQGYHRSSILTNPLHLIAQHDFGCVASPVGMDIGGDGFNMLVLGSLDGSIRLSELDPLHREVRPWAHGPLAEAHAGEVAAIAPHPSLDGAVLSCGSDGTLRLWFLSGGHCRCQSKRTFSSAQTAIATCANRELVAVGSETGVLRQVPCRVTLLQGGGLSKTPVTSHLT